MTVEHSRKKARTSSSVKFGALCSHPFGVQPYGNMLFSDDQNNVANRRTGLGSLSVMPDEALIALLIGNIDCFDDSDIFKLIRCSKALYVMCNHDSIWRDRTIARFKGDFGPFSNSWKNTYKTRLQKERPDVELVLDVPLKVGFYSDYLFSSWRCSSVPLNDLCRSNAPENIDRREGLTMEQFVEEYDKPGKPVILTDVVTKWPAFKKWNMDYLESTVGDIVFRAESVDLPFKTYAAYAKHCRDNGGSFEEAPLYLFDKYFSARTKLADDFTVPEYFNQDLFQLLGANERPDYRWIIIGPPRSGSTFHLDPNSTSAWNAVITGSKKWLLFPPDCVPPGVFPSADGSEVTTPISLAEWFLNHYDEIKRWPVKPIECICRAGEIIYVPRGWWHCVMNLEESIALTQNFVNDCNLSQVLTMLREKPGQISGYGSGENACRLAETMYSRFSAALQNTHADVVEGETKASQRNISIKDKGRADKTPSIANLFTQPEMDESPESKFSFRFSF